MSRCKKCNKYIDLFEWPQDQIEHYRPDICFECFVSEQESAEQDEEESENFDPNTEYGMPEVHPDPEDDDTPILTEDVEVQELEEDNEHEEDRPKESDDLASLKNLQRMLFG